MHKVTKNQVSGSCWLVVGYSWSSSVIFGASWQYLVIMDDFWCFLCSFVTKWCYILCYSLLFVACSEILLTFLYETFINGCKLLIGTSIKGGKSIFQRRKPSKLWPNMVMAKDVSHTFNGTSKSLMARIDFFCGSLLHPCGQLWAESWRSFPPFDGWKWPSK